MEKYNKKFKKKNRKDKQYIKFLTKKILANATLGHIVD